MGESVSDCLVLNSAPVSRGGSGVHTLNPKSYKDLSVNPKLQYLKPGLW